MNIRLKLIILILILSFAKLSYSQVFGNAQMNTILSAQSETEFLFAGATFNPANISQIEGMTFSLGYSPSRFGLSELSPMTAAFANKYKSFAYGVSVYNLGNSLYREYAASFLTSYTAYDDFVIAISGEFDRLDVENYSSESIFSLNLGTRVMLSEDLNASFVLRNLNNASFSQSDKLTYRTAVLGIGYQSDEKFYYGVNAVVFIEHASGFNFNVIYTPIDDLSIRISAATYPSSLELGVKFLAFEGISVVASLYYHNYLGFIQNYGVNYVVE